MRIAMTTLDMERALELRKIRRYYVQAPALFNWKETDSSARAAEGVTRDISMRAVFVVARLCPRVGDQLQIEVQLPSLRGIPGIRLRGEGVVLRVDRNEAGEGGFAVATPLRCGTRQSIDMLLRLVPESGRTQ